MLRRFGLGLGVLIIVAVNCPGDTCRIDWISNPKQLQVNGKGTWSVSPTSGPNARTFTSLNFFAQKVVVPPPLPAGSTASRDGANWTGSLMVNSTGEYKCWGELITHSQVPNPQGGYTLVPHHTIDNTVNGNIN